MRNDSHQTAGKRYLKIRPLCGKKGLGRSFVYAAIKTLGFPAPVKLAPRLAVWDEDEVDAWIAKRAAARNQAGAEAPAKAA